MSRSLGTGRPRPLDMGAEVRCRGRRLVREMHTDSLPVRLSLVVRVQEVAR